MVNPFSFFILRGKKLLLFKKKKNRNSSISRQSLANHSFLEQGITDNVAAPRSSPFFHYNQARHTNDKSTVPLFHTSPSYLSTCNRFLVLESIHQPVSVPKRTLSTEGWERKKFSSISIFSSPHTLICQRVISTLYGREFGKSEEERANRVLELGSGDYKIYVERGREEFVGFTWSHNRANFPRQSSTRGIQLCNRSRTEGVVAPRAIVSLHPRLFSPPPPLSRHGIRE